MKEKSRLEYKYNINYRDWISKFTIIIKILNGNQIKNIMITSKNRNPDREDFAKIKSWTAARKSL